MEYDDYLLTVRGNRMKYDLQESWIRRQTYLLLDTMARLGRNKGGYTSYMFNANWPVSHKMSEDIIESLKAKRELAKKEAVKLSTNVLLQEAIKNRKKLGRPNKNSNNGRRK